MSYKSNFPGITVFKILKTIDADNDVYEVSCSLNELIKLAQGDGFIYFEDPVGGVKLPLDGVPEDHEATFGNEAVVFLWSDDSTRTASISSTD